MAETSITNDDAWVLMCDFDFEIFEGALGCFMKTIENSLLDPKKYSAF